MALSEIDKNLLQQCLARQPRAWDEFVNRFLGLVVHVVNHTAQSRSIRLAAADREDLVAEVFLAVISDDFSLLRRFRGESSLATYLTVVARRVAVRELLKRRTTAALNQRMDPTLAEGGNGHGDGSEQRISDREEVQRLLEELDGEEAEVVRMYHLDGLSYREISSQVGMLENSVGPTLSRARAKMRRAGADSTIS